MIAESLFAAGVLAAIGFVTWRRSRSPYFPSQPGPNPLELAAGAVESDLDVIRSVVVARSGRFEARRHASAEDPATTVIEVAGLSREIGIVRESGGTAFHKRMGAREMETGDKPFDDELFVSGPPVALRAMLDQHTRRRILGVFRGQTRPDDRSAPLLLSSVSLKGGLLQARVRPQAGLTLLEDVHGDAAHTLLDLARRLELPTDIAERLARNAREDAEPQVRLRNLVALEREYPRHVATRTALREAATVDQSRDIRLEAALALGEEGRPALLALLDEVWVDDTQLARAVEALGADVPTAKARALLREALDRRRPQTARACLATLGRVGGPDAIEALGEVLASQPSEMGALAARSLGMTDGRAEPALLEGLRHNAPAVREEAARALGIVGTVAAVPPLRALEGDADEDRASRRAAREAIAAIQSRLAGATPGQLAIADAGAGQLSVADDVAGRVAFGAEPGPAKPGA